MGERHWFVLYVLICLEVGVFLLLVPWSVIWERNYFLEAYPSLRPILLSPTLRGAVCGLGLANIYLGVNEVLQRWRASVARRIDTELVGDTEGDHEPPRREQAHRAEASKALVAPDER